MAAVEEFYFQWHLTQRCNFRCQHCYQAGDGGVELAWGDLKLVADEIALALSKWKCLGHIALTGGEPLLRAETLDLLDYLAEAPEVGTIDLLTNGTLVDDRVVGRLVATPKFRRVQVSLDGSSPQTHDAIRGPGAFAKALSAIRKLVQAGVTTRVMFTLHRDNVADVPGLVELALREGLEGVVVDRLVPVGRGAALKGLLLQPAELRDVYHDLFLRSEELAHCGSSLHIVKLRTLWALVEPRRMSEEADLPVQQHLGAMCSAGMAGLCILEDGTVLPCRRLPIPLGNVLHDSLFEIWYTSPVLWQLRDRSGIKGKCRDCEYASRCGGCRAMAYAVTGDHLEADPQCWKN